MELRQILYFIGVAKREHMTEAAKALHVAQSAVSRQIFNLEAELGVDLFLREGRNIKLTTIGEIFLKHMEQVVNVIDDAKQDVKEYTDPEQGTIHIGFPSSLAIYILPTVISSFQETFPNVKFKLTQDSYNNLKDSIVKGDVNIALLAPVPTNEPKTKGIILFTEKLNALLPMNHPLANASTINLNELKNDSFVLFPKGFILREKIEQGCRQIGFRPKVSFEGTDIEGIKGLVSAGLGVSLIPEIALVDNLPRATVAIPIEEPNMNRTVGMMISTERKLLPTEQLFYDFIKQFFSRLEQFQK